MFDSAIGYMSSYRTARADALDNKSRQRWFTSDVSAVSELIDDKFSSDTENNQWETMFNDRDTPESHLACVRLKIHFLASSRRDIRTQFAAWGNSRVRVPADSDRFEYMRLAFGNFKMTKLKQVVDIKGAA